ncbi:hypothetical protein ARMSODRAFT_1004097 [Armillaria solidipes]|uniref:Uncharacterized protein n=1 Tax=Armillaria solidipes TaxID=1076256 RepID=A0A2H3BK61_9AGAR|nr:hypothetical protein ARMSODRAFT_1004097 [Armillaria solidipes]
MHGFPQSRVSEGILVSRILPSEEQYTHMGTLISPSHGWPTTYPERRMWNPPGRSGTLVLEAYTGMYDRLVRAGSTPTQNIFVTHSLLDHNTKTGEPTRRREDGVERTVYGTVDDEVQESNVLANATAGLEITMVPITEQMRTIMPKFQAPECRPGRILLYKCLLGSMSMDLQFIKVSGGLISDSISGCARNLQGGTSVFAFWNVFFVGDASHGV